MFVFKYSLTPTDSLVFVTCLCPTHSSHLSISRRCEAEAVKYIVVVYKGRRKRVKEDSTEGKIKKEGERKRREKKKTWK